MPTRMGAGASVVLIRGPLSGWSAEIDARYPLWPQALSVGVNVAAAQDFDYNYALASTRCAICDRYQPGRDAIPRTGRARLQYCIDAVGDVTLGHPSGSSLDLLA